MKKGVLALSAACLLLAPAAGAQQKKKDAPPGWQGAVPLSLRRCV